MLLKSMKFHKNDETHFPFQLSFFNKTIDFNAPIIILIGTNGCGKSTLLELIQSKLGLYQIGKPIKALKEITESATFNLKKPKGFYFSSEDFTTYIHELESEKQQSKEAIKEVDRLYKNRSEFARMQAKVPYAKTLGEIHHLHDRNLSESSHGEAYLSFFKSRMRPNQLILLDEPETPLSFENQLSLMYLIKESIQDGSQFIIATHSPIMMAFPQAKIYEFRKDELIEVAYEEIDAVRNMKSFLNNPEIFLRHLFD